MKLRLNAKYLCIAIIIFLLEAAIALFINDRFIRPYVGDVLVVALIYYVVRAFVQFTQGVERLLPAYIFIFAFLVELGQYFGLVELLGLGGNKIMRIVLGSTFDIKDIACYFVGCLFLFLFNLYFCSFQNKKGN